MNRHDQPPITLDDVVEQFATAMKAADRRGPQAVNPASRHAYHPGIGPHPEHRAVDLVMKELALQRPAWRWSLRDCDPISKQPCDWLLGRPVQWIIEIRMARPNCDNGKPHDIAVRDILSPYAMDHSALSDCVRLADPRIASRRAILIYGFDDPRRPLSEIISAFETLAAARVSIGPLHYAELAELVHPVHRKGGVYGWEIHPTTSAPAFRIPPIDRDFIGNAANSAGERRLPGNR